MPKYSINYYNARGFAEISRWIFAAAGEEYEDNRWEPEQWPEHKKNSPTGKAPWLEVDGEKIGQSTAMARYLAKQFGFAGKTAMEEAKVDMVAAIHGDVVTAVMKAFGEKDEEKKAALKKTLGEETVPEFFTMYENLLVGNNGGDGYFVGDSLTWCDMQTVLCLDVLTLLEMPELQDKYPKLKALKARVEGNPGIAKWIETRPKTTM